MDRINKKKIVKEFLEMDCRARDDDPYLYVKLAKRLQLDHLDTYDLLLRLDYPAVVRARRSVQAEYEELRGKSYGKRQSYAAEYKKLYKPNYFDKMRTFLNRKKEN